MTLIVDTKDILSDLIGFDTTSHRSNLALIDYIEKYLAKHGVHAHVLHAAEQAKANLIATIGPNVPGGVVLSGHTDVVPVDGQDWHTPPFKMTDKDGNFYGRGTADMKGFIAVVLAYVPVFTKAKLTRPIHLAFSFDEEVGCLGVQEMLPFLKENVPLPRLVVIGEPTSMQVATAHKGQYVMKTKVIGQEAHSSRPDDGVNAVVVAAELISMIDEMAQNSKKNGPFDDAFSPSYTTFNIGPISGGSAFNIISNYCEFDWEFRFLPTVDGPAIAKKYQQYLDDEVVPRIRMKFPHCNVTNEMWAYLPPLKSEPGADGESFALALAQRNDSTVIAFGTEGGHFQNLEFPVVVCGPGDIAHAHKPNEFVPVTQLEACGRFMQRLSEAMAT
ncbi:acetylornithine deacetylase [Kordiimonas aquimaris]|uniref:acetylornithine deacetylase n=1 Tax=Kordiimonas aquimaris TaxID=707591 RepID=UPI0021CEAD09|nr:acetylornithine deacetylase [Kordiimonas aquimaris]